MTERLTEKIMVSKDGEILGYRIKPFHERQATQKLAEYENAKEEVRLVVLPCDTVYFIWDKSSGISHVRAKSILDLSLREILGIDKDGRYWSVKEEAEKALENMKL